MRGFPKCRCPKCATTASAIACVIPVSGDAKEVWHLVGEYGRIVIKDGVMHHLGVFHEPCLNLVAAF